jgi:hypothetical protein
VAEIKDLSVTDASNTTRFAESQAPSTVNNGARALEGLLARALKDTVDGWLITAGTGSAYTATPNRSFTASATMYDGAEFSVQFHAACADTATLNIGTTDARKLFNSDGTTISASDIIAGSRAVVKYNTSLSGWIVMDSPVPAKTAVTATAVKQGKHTIWVPASAMIAATTSGPASAQFESGTNDNNFKVLDFDATADEHAHFNIAFPASWDEGTVTFQVFWMSSATDTDGVAWGLQGAAVSDNEGTDVTWGTAIVVTDDAQSAASEVYVTAESSAVTIGGSPAAADICFMRIFRDVSDANDDMTEDARLIGVKIFYTINAANDA